jgi:hypothetical protein
MPFNGSLSACQSVAYVLAQLTNVKLFQLAQTMLTPCTLGVCISVKRFDTWWLHERFRIDSHFRRFGVHIMSTSFPGAKIMQIMHLHNTHYSYTHIPIYMYVDMDKYKKMYMCMYVYRVRIGLMCMYVHTLWRRYIQLQFGPGRPRRSAIQCHVEYFDRVVSKWIYCAVVVYFRWSCADSTVSRYGNVEWQQSTTSGR